MPTLTADGTPVKTGRRILGSAPDRPTFRLYQEPAPGGVDERGRTLIGYAPTLYLHGGTVSQGYAFRDRAVAQKIVDISLDDPEVASAEVEPVYDIPAESGQRLPLMAETIIEALRESLAPLSGKQIAAKSGYSNSSRLRTMLAELRKAGYVLRNSEGYRLASKNVFG